MKGSNIVLIGFMGSGKSSVGRLLSKRLGYQLKDTDDMIEAQEGMTVQEIFKQDGEEVFRDLETALLLSIEKTLEKTVLSTGGGMPIRDKNYTLLGMMGQVVYLRASETTIIDRLSKDTTRPLLKGENLKDRVEQLLLQRTSVYEKAADIIIDTDNKTIDEIVKEIIGGSSSVIGNAKL